MPRPRCWTAWEALDCSYVLGLAGNRRLKAMAQPWCEDAALRRLASPKQKIRRFHQAAYQAGSWDKPRRVIARIEAGPQGAD